MPMSQPPVSQPQPAMSFPNAPQVSAAGDSDAAKRIKLEPGLEHQNPPPMAQQSYVHNGMSAQQRAMNHLANNFGERAAASISSMQNNAPQQGHQQMHPPYPQQSQPQQPPQQGQPQSQAPTQPSVNIGIPRPNMMPKQQSQQSYSQSVAAQMVAARNAAMKNNSAANNGQTDGAGDDEPESVGIMKHISASGEEVEMGRIEIDNMIRRKIEAMGQSMEGGGLMLPLKEHVPSSRNKRKTIPRPVATGTADGPSKAPAQFDGPNDDDKSNIKDEDLDEDAINSDLDDPDDGLNDEEEDDDSMGHIMLCMYDKVQRVKNKW
jgi:transcription initiation factor TFIIA large subunit